MNIKSMKENTITIKGFIFDLDETLIDSKDSIIEYHRRLFEFLGIEYKKEHSYWFYTLPAEEISNRLFPDDKLRERAKEFRYSFNPSDLFHMIKLKPGVPDILQQLKENKYKIGLVTNRGISTRPLLKNKDLTKYFDKIVPANEVPLNKPDPYPINYILDEWNILKEETVYIGDSEVDIECGNRAGVHTVTVGRKFDNVMYIDTLNEIHKLTDKLENLSYNRG